MSDQPSSIPVAGSGALLLADIGGYTSFLQSVAAAHADDAFAGGRIPDAYALVSSLLDGIVGRIAPPFTLSKLEGDAVFAYATEAVVIPRGPAMLACIRACHADFHERLRAAHDVWACRCAACARIDQLELKFIVHAGSFVLQQIAGRQEVVGPDVVMAHRLLKSRAAEAVDSPAYALITDAAVRAFGIPADGAVAIVETYDHYPPIAARVWSLAAS